jgi:hypothetical protein
MFTNKISEAKQAKIVKLNQTKSIPSLTRSNSFETESSNSSEIDENENDVTGESLTKLCVINDYKSGQYAYGDISVRKGQLIYLIFETDAYYFIENEHGKQGFIPKEICINLDEMIQQAKIKKSLSKITSL